MAIHDPESSVHEKQLALKLGRQKKIQMIDGQQVWYFFIVRTVLIYIFTNVNFIQVEVMHGLDSEDEEEDSEMIAVEGSDGQQYVVLEVIQLADGEEQTMVVGSGSSDMLGDNIMSDAGKHKLIMHLSLHT